MAFGIVRVVAAAVAATSALTLAGSVFGEWVVTLPPTFGRGAASALVALGIPFEDVAFSSDDGLTLRGWWIPASLPDSPAIVYAPSTSHDQRSGISLVPVFHEAGYHVLLFSYRGHARSDGWRGRFTYGAAESTDVDAAVRYIWDERGVREIGIIGHSAGAVSAIMSAARNPRLGAVVAVAPFASLAEVWHTSRPRLVPRFVLDMALWLTAKWKGFETDDVSAEKVIDRIAPRPVLVIHGTDDRRITEDQVRRLYGAAEAPKGLWMVQGATHDGIREEALDLLAPNVIAFLDAALRQGDGSMAALSLSLDRMGEMPALGIVRQPDLIRPLV